MNDSVPMPRSLAQWAFEALGLTYVVLLPLSALVTFILVLIVLIRGKGPMAAVSILLLVHVPFLIGIYAALHGLINSYTMIATSGTTPKPADVAQGFSLSLFAPLIAMLLMIPSYVVAIAGTIVRGVFGRRDARDDG